MDSSSVEANLIFHFFLRIKHPNTHFTKVFALREGMILYLLKKRLNKL